MTQAEASIKGKKIWAQECDEKEIELSREEEFPENDSGKSIHNQVYRRKSVHNQVYRREDACNQVYRSKSVRNQVC